MANNKLVFKDAEKVRDTMLASQKKQIAGLYQQWADEIGEMADHYAHRSSASSAVSERQMRELQKMMEQTSKEVANEVHKSIKQNIYAVADSVVQCNNQWLASLGFNEGILGMTFNHVPDSIVRKIVTGQIYDSGWSLSSRIWSDNEDTMKQAYQIVAGGVAQNKPMYEIAKDLEKYVSPSAAKPWNLRAPDGKKIYPKDVDYNAQRLGRTLVQHGYQQSFVATTQKNPFITDYIWISNGSRVCDLCAERDGKHFSKDDLPLDHPNGMCTMVPNVADDLTGQLADWFNSPDGTYPEIDAFAGNFGYKAEKLIDMNSLTNNLTEYVGGGYLSVKDAVSEAEFEYIKKNMTASSRPFYRLEEMEFTASKNSLKVGSEFNFDDDLRSFTSKSGNVVKFLEDAEDWGGYQSPVVFQTSGRVKHFDMSPFTKTYTELMGDQSEHLLGGKMKVVGLEYKTIKNVEVLFVNVEQVDDVVRTLSSAQKKTILGSPTEVSKAEFDRWTKSLSSSKWDEILANDPLYTSTDHFGPHYKEALGRHFIATNYPEGSTIRGMSLDGTRLTPRQKAVAFFNEKMQPFKDAVSGVNSKALGTGAPSWTTWREAMKGQTREMLDAEDIKRLNAMGGTAKKSLYSYTTDQFVEINSFMRESAARGFDDVASALKASKANDKHLKHIENIVEGFDKAPGLPADRILCRGSDIGELAGLFGPDDFASNLANLNTMTVDQLNDALSGAVGRYTGFTSTGGLYGSGFNVGGSEVLSAATKMGDVGGVEFYIYAPQGTKAVSVTSLSKYGTFGDEVLVNAGTTVKFQQAVIEDSTGVVGKKRIAVFLEIIGQ